MSARYGSRTRTGEAVSNLGRRVTAGTPPTPGPPFTLSGGTQTAYYEILSPSSVVVHNVTTFTSPGTFTITGGPGTLLGQVLVVGGGEPGGPLVQPGYPSLQQPGYGGEAGLAQVSTSPTDGLTAGSYSITLGTSSGTSTTVGATPYTAGGYTTNPYTPSPRSVPGAPVGPLTTNGGGAGGTGNAPGSPRPQGGPGITNSLRTGSPVPYVVGGNAGIYASTPAGGNRNGPPAPANSGSGGEGAYGGPGPGSDAFVGGTGGSGIFVFRCLSTDGGFAP